MGALQAQLSAAGAGAVAPVPAALPDRTGRRLRGGPAAVLRRDRGPSRHEAFAAHLAPLRRKNWFVYAKPPFAEPEAVLAHLARYTHRIAIANSRLIALGERGVTFRHKDYRRNGQARYRTMTLSADEFVRRFLLHVLPKGFHRIRHYGLLASPASEANIARARELIAAPMPEVEPSVLHDTADPDAVTDHRPPCPCCGGRMMIVEVFGRGGAPCGPPSAPAGGHLTR
jgi:Putative transposase